MGGFAWVTLATNDSYSLGALVLAHSLKQAGTTQQLAVLITPGVTEPMREKLRTVFNVVQEVNILDSRDETNLKLLKRPELGITFTKLHCWRLSQYEKCVFLDADTLVLQNCDELFERDELSAAPDVGWPDCFNSGVFVYRPSNDTFEKLIQFALEKGSFDGGDQGLLNLYFSDWAHKDISKHLPFIYNMCSTACYSYLPAYKQFGGNAKIIHFIGATKPWLQYFNTETRKVQPSGDSGHLQEVLQRWWDIFCSLIHPELSPNMPEGRSQQNVNYSNPSHSQSYSHSPNQTTQQSSSANDFQIDYDPWDEYYKKQTEIDQSSTQIRYSSQESPSLHISCDQPNEPPNTNASFVAEHLPPPSQPQAHDSSSTYHPNHHNFESHDRHHQTDFHDKSHHDHPQQYNEPRHQLETDIHHTTHYNYQLIQSHNEGHFQTHFEDISQEQSTSHIVEHTETHFHDPPPILQCVHNHESNETSQHHHNETHYRPSLPTDDPGTSSNPETSTEYKTKEIVSNEISLAHSTDDCDKTNESAGLAGAFARLTLGVARTPEQDAFESVMRKQAWEVGNIDYLGKDSFDNIWSKISETLSSVPTTVQPSVAVEPSKQVEVPKEDPPKAGLPKSEAVLSETPKVDVPTSPDVTDTITSPPVQTSQPLQQEVPPKAEASIVTAVSATELPSPAAELKSEPETPSAVGSDAAKFAEETKPVDLQPVESVVESPTVQSSSDVFCPLPAKVAESPIVLESPQPLPETEVIKESDGTVPAQRVGEKEAAPIKTIESGPSDKASEVPVPAQSEVKTTEVIKESGSTVPAQPVGEKEAAPVKTIVSEPSDKALEVPVSTQSEVKAIEVIKESGGSVPAQPVCEKEAAPVKTIVSEPSHNASEVTVSAQFEVKAPEAPVECKKSEPATAPEPVQEVPQPKPTELKPSVPTEEVPQSQITEPTPPATPSTPPTAPLPQLEKVKGALDVQSDVPVTPPPSSSQDASPTPPPRKEGKPKKGAAAKPKK